MAKDVRKHQCAIDHKFNRAILSLKFLFNPFQGQSSRSAKFLVRGENRNCYFIIHSNKPNNDGPKSNLKAGHDIIKTSWS